MAQGLEQTILLKYYFHFYLPNNSALRKTGGQRKKDLEGSIRIFWLPDRDHHVWNKNLNC